MNIGIFTDTFYPQISGVDTSVRMLAEGLKRLGHRPLIFTTTDPAARENLPDVFRLPSFPFFSLPSRRVTFFYPPKLIIKMKSFNLDIVHTQTEFTIGLLGKLTAEALHVPMLHTYHTMYENYTHYVANGRLMTPKMARQFSRLFCNGATAVTTPAEKTKELLLEYGVRKPVYYVPTGINFDNFRREAFTPEEVRDARENIGGAAGDKILINIGRVAKEKSLDVIIKAMPRLLESVPEAKFISVGDGPYIQELITLAESLGVSRSVIFAGPRPWQSIGKYYQASDVFVSASTTETQGITYIEAMAAKIPLIAKRDKSLEGILRHDETGLFFDTEDELAQSAGRLLNNPDEAYRLTECAWQGIQQLSAEAFCERMLEIYKDLIDSYPKNNKESKIRLKLKKSYKQ